MAQPAIPNPIKASSLQTGLAPKSTFTPPAPKVSKKKPTTSFEILKAALQEAKIPPKDANSFMSNLAGSVKSKVSQLVQIGQTVFLINNVDNKAKPLPPGTVEMYPFTIEPNEAPQRLKVLPNTLKQMGIKKIITRTDDPQDVAMMQSTGLPINVRQEMVYTGMQMSPMYVIEMDL
jgi:hypothetical protein